MATSADTQAMFDVPSFRPDVAFPCLTERMIRCIRSYRRKLLIELGRCAEADYDSGTQLSTAGQRGAEMFVVLAGSIAVYTENGRNHHSSLIELSPPQF